ncbi:uncharacterized protein N7503_007557 [Penicillium pulvis]|uniref:uncharacterized protein n=1 Tax=Penicillium pulvis TaxID=1562058 RepID=UPI00254745E9|nr:uncharacterized protein N7503_007557 [Penicillium pulvis]KAJ5798261.1 hypothetical protein N7503_007557 [Penicillium pulvis]
MQLILLIYPVLFAFYAQQGNWNGSFHVPGASTYSGAKGLLESLVPNIAAESTPFGLAPDGDGNQPGDPRKAADIIIKAVKGEGRCEGMTLPPCLPLGADGVQAIRGNSEAKSKVCNAWEVIASATDF